MPECGPKNRNNLGLYTILLKKFNTKLSQKNRMEFIKIVIITLSKITMPHGVWFVLLLTVAGVYSRE